MSFSMVLPPLRLWIRAPAILLYILNGWPAITNPRTQLAVPYSLGTFVGAEHKVNTTLTASLSIAGVSRPWDFLVIDRMPAEVVLGLDLMLYWPIFINPVDRCLYVPPQHISHPPNWFTPAKNTPTTPTPTLRALFSSLTINPSLSPRDTLSPIVSSNHQGVTASGSEEAEELNTFLDNAPPPLKTVVSKHLSLFKPPDRDPPDRPVKHFIQVTPDCVPAARQPYPLAEIKLQALRAQMRELIDKGWVIPSSSPWAAPILFVAKDNGSKLRMCVDFRRFKCPNEKRPLPSSTPRPTTPSFCSCYPFFENRFSLRIPPNRSSPASPRTYRVHPAGSGGWALPMGVESNAFRPGERSSNFPTGNGCRTARLQGLYVSLYR